MSRAAMDKFPGRCPRDRGPANAQLLDAIDELALTYPGDRRWRIEHAQIIDPADLPRFGKNGIIASMQPVHQTSDRLMAEARLGPDRLAGAYAWQSVLKMAASWRSDRTRRSKAPIPSPASPRPSRAKMRRASRSAAGTPRSA
jgi:predicted amidohydrolase YtcJ